MKTIAALFGLIATLFLAAPAAATPAPSGPSFETCTNLKGWYVNPDETSRRPTPTVAGLKFEGNDLIHHGATGSIEGLTAGTFTASPAPDQPSFFSVEVRNGDGSGYATLRWNTTSNKWTMVTGGQAYENTSAAELVKMPEPDKSSALLSFGVGYTNNPPGTVAATVSSVTFRGTKYDLACAPAASPSASASGSASASASANASASASSSAAATEGLPVTGMPVGVLVGAGVLVLGGGGLLLFLARRQKARFIP